jgi:hypothetical protein
MARTPDPSLHLLWRDRVRRQAHSGLTIAQFKDLNTHAARMAAEKRHDAVSGPDARATGGGRMAPGLWAVAELGLAASESSDIMT